MSFKIKPWVKIVYLATFLMIVVVLIGFYILLVPFQSMNGEFAFGELNTLFLLVFIQILLAFWFGTFFYAAYNATLIIHDDHMEFRTIPYLSFLIPSWLRSFRFNFKDIVSIKAGKRLLFWEITGSNSQVGVLNPGFFKKEDVERILDLLRKHIPQDRIEPGLGIFDPRKHKFYKPLLIFQIIAVAAFFATILLDGPFSIRSQLNNAWHVEMRLPRSESSAWINFAETPNNLWVMTNDYSHPYRVYNQKGAQTQTWDLPELGGNDYPYLLNGDSNGNPIIWFDDKVLYRNKDQWKTVFYESGIHLYSRFVASGELGWCIATKDNKRILVNLNATTGKWEEIPLPEKASQQNLAPRNVKRATNGDLLVLATNTTNTRVYVYSNNVWRDVEYPVIVSENQDVQDYFLDADAALWALVGDYKEQLVEKISSTGELKLTFLPDPVRNRSGLYEYDYLIVDSRDRLWLSGGYPDFMAVFAPQWDREATQLIVYTTENSDYQADLSSPPIYFANGLIFSGEDHFYSINTDVETLPAPLPAWFADLDMDNLGLVALFAQLIITLLMNMYLYKNPNYRQRKELPSA